MGRPGWAFPVTIEEVIRASAGICAHWNVGRPRVYHSSTASLSVHGPPLGAFIILLKDTLCGLLVVGLSRFIPKIESGAPATPGFARFLPSGYVFCRTRSCGF